MISKLASLITYQVTTKDLGIPSRSLWSKVKPLPKRIILEHSKVCKFPPRQSHLAEFFSEILETRHILSTWSKHADCQVFVESS